MTTGTLPLWIGFGVFILLMLALDLGIFHRKVHTIRSREALFWTIVWIVLALAFNGAVYFWFGAEKALEFLTGYLIERALSIDNIFVFVVLFSYFSVPSALHHRVLFWGILGAVLMRGIFIGGGTLLIHSFHWIIYLFGFFLVVTGIKLLVQKETKIQPERNPVFRLFRRFIPMVSDYHGGRFIVREKGRLLATPLLLVLVVTEATDVLFAVDSIPAIFAITIDPFIVFTSNIFAILGLRALYFLFANMMDKFHYLSIGLAFVLVFVGGKMLLSGYYDVPILASLVVVAVLILVSLAFSLLFPKNLKHL